MMTPSPRELAAQSAKFQREQERLMQDLLTVLDSLDHACEHWQQAEQDHAQTLIQSLDLPASPSSLRNPPRRWAILRQWQQQLQAWLDRAMDIQRTTTVKPDPQPDADSMTEVLASAREGVEMIQRSLLEILNQHQVVPLRVLGQPFDPSRMCALGRQECEDTDENTVIQEVVRGYLWQNRILRESQVIVAVKPLVAQSPE
jgi:molecular chaperone GrpE (heat shock protein)